MNNEPQKQQIEETQELGSKVKELLKPENLIGPFNSVQDFMKSLWDEELLVYEMATVVSTSDRYISVNPDSNLEWFNEEYFMDASLAGNLSVGPGIGMQLVALAGRLCPPDNGLRLIGAGSRDEE